MRRGSSEIALRCVVLDGRRQDSCGVVGGVFAVHFEGFGEGVGHVVGFVELGLLDGGGFLEGGARFMVCYGVSRPADRGGED